MFWAGSLRSRICNFCNWPKLGRVIMSSKFFTFIVMLSGVAFASIPFFSDDPLMHGMSICRQLFCSALFFVIGIIGAAGVIGVTTGFEPPSP